MMHGLRKRIERLERESRRFRAIDVENISDEDLDVVVSAQSKALDSVLCIMSFSDLSSASEFVKRSMDRYSSSKAFISDAEYVLSAIEIEMMRRLGLEHPI